MKTILIIIVIASLGLLAGCSASRKNRAVTVEPSPAAVAEPQSPEAQVPEVAPFGNAALAGKPEEGEAAEHVWDFRDATTWLLGNLSLTMLNNPPHSEWYTKDTPHTSLTRE